MSLAKRKTMKEKITQHGSNVTKVLTILAALAVMLTAASGGVMAADGDANETITVGASGDYTTVQEAVDAANSSQHTHIVITTADVNGNETLWLDKETDDLYFEVADEQNNSIAIDGLENPYDTQWNSSSSVTFDETIEGANESYVIRVGNGERYNSINEATNHSTRNDIIEAESGVYTENVKLEAENTTIKSLSANNLTIDGNLDVSNVTEFRLGEYVTVNEIVGVNGGGGGGGDSTSNTGSSVVNTLEKTYYGVAAWVYGLAAIIVLAALYGRKE